MRIITRSKMLAAVVGVSASLIALAPAPAVAAVSTSAGCKSHWGKLDTKNGHVSFVAKVCDNFAQVRGTVVDTKSDTWTAVVEVDFYDGSKKELEWWKEAGRKSGRKDFNFSASRTDIDKVVVKARRCLPGTIVCNNTATKTVKL